MPTMAFALKPRRDGVVVDCAGGYASPQPRSAAAAGSSDSTRQKRGHAGGVGGVVSGGADVAYVAASRHTYTLRAEFEGSGDGDRFVSRTPAGVSRELGQRRQV